MPAIVKDSKSNYKTDPLRNFRFQFNINKTTSKGSMAARLGFMSASGLGMETQVVAYREGGFNTTTQKMPGQTDFPPITCTRGMMPGYGDQYEWMKEIFTVIQGGGTALTSDFRTTIDIFVLAHPWTGPNVPIKAKFKVYNAWIASLTYSDLDAGGNAVLLEQMVLQHEGFGVAYADASSYRSEAPAVR